MAAGVGVRVGITWMTDPRVAVAARLVNVGAVVAVELGMTAGLAVRPGVSVGLTVDVGVEVSLGTMVLVLDGPGG